ncbi:TetR family transcriptional regulator [Sphaerisporangium sp. TRM90804]|uniref:TetR/AcrR family transcriptional regulator n=1 Tax=Sphaerisporangium sp. TRM90804 TaxID=3031113 RepID=UPI00244735A9|nr:TetR family transcriptional regulator [Sphaerisporangium sp. TRM90804]MDH2430592.1 TetR family transcriptional regulator [Sphaerisporangium sp. TRM90804]
MGRVSRAQARQNREQVVAAAGRLFRERGVQQVSVADLMAEAGLTHGGFYRQFASKEALVAEATEHAFAGMRQLMEERDLEHPGDREAARRALVEYYLSPGHRDDPGGGCAAAGLGPDMARDDGDAPARAPYAEGVREFARWLSGGREEDLATVCTLVGALVLARATAGSELSDQILAAARGAVSAGRA